LREAIGLLQTVGRSHVLGLSGVIGLDQFAELGEDLGRRSVVGLSRGIRFLRLDREAARQSEPEDCQVHSKTSLAPPSLAINYQLPNYQLY
jgi:hypothetical protein